MANDAIAGALDLVTKPFGTDLAQVTPVELDVTDQLESQSHDPSGIIDGLAGYDPGTLVTEEGLAEIFDRHRTSILRAVKRGELPPPITMFGQKCWTMDTICEHINERLGKAAEDYRRARQYVDQTKLTKRSGGQNGGCS